MQVDPKRTLPLAKKQVASVVGEPVSDFKGFFNATQTIFKSLRKEFFSKQFVSGNLAKTCRYRHIFSLTLYRNKSNFSYCTLLNRAQLFNLG